MVIEVMSELVFFSIKTFFIQLNLFLFPLNTSEIYLSKLIVSGRNFLLKLSAKHYRVIVFTNFLFFIDEQQISTQ